jgi:hypothetical protein
VRVVGKKRAPFLDERRDFFSKGQSTARLYYIIPLLKRGTGEPPTWAAGGEKLLASILAKDIILLFLKIPPLFPCRSSIYTVFHFYQDFPLFNKFELQELKLKKYAGN